MKTIWIINHYAGRALIEKGFRAYWMAKYLSKMDYNPVIICCNTYHGEPKQIFQTNKKIFFKEAEEIHSHFVYIAGRTYTNNGKDRVLNITDFCVNFFRNYKKIIDKYGKPEIILGSSIHPLAPAMAIKLSKKLDAKCICEFRDLWPEELIQMKAISRFSPIAIALRKLEYWTFRKADALVFTMEGAPQYIKRQKWDIDSGGKVCMSNVYYINNGVDLDEYKDNIDKYPLEDKDLNDDRLFKIIYTGSIQRANGIDNILDVAKKIRHQNIKFLLYGAGSEVDRINRRIKEEGISNVVYKGNISKQSIPYVLSKSNINLLNYLNGDLFKYGCSNNKIFEYMASGNPIICNVHMNYSILRKYNCGIEAGSEKEVLEAIELLYSNENLMKELRRNSLEAIKNYDYKILAHKLDEVVNRLINQCNL